MPQIEIIPIARRKIERRGIPEQWVIETLTSPSQIVDGYGDCKVAQKKYWIRENEYLLRVVFEDKEGGFVVVTGYLTSQIDRYWRED